MKYAIMSDAHANPLALKTAIADARSLGCGKFIFAGDITGYGYDAKTTLDIVRENFDVVLLGNHDSACAGLEPAWEVQMISNYALDREARDELPPDDIEWMRTLPLQHSEDGFAVVHGDFTNPKAWNYMDSMDVAEMNFRKRKERLMFCGHTHHAMVWEATGKGVIREKLASRFAQAALKPESVSFKLTRSRHVVNCGSVGYPRADLCSSYAIFDSAAANVCVRRLPFDFQSYMTEMLKTAHALPDWLVEILLEASQKEAADGRRV